MNESIDSLNQRFLELRPNADNNEKAKSLNPINVRKELGRTVFLYENIDIEKLSSLGDVRPPFIADLFCGHHESTRRTIMKVLITLVKRELQEHKVGLIYAPFIVAIILSVVIVLVYFGVTDIKNQ